MPKGTKTISLATESSKFLSTGFKFYEFFFTFKLNSFFKILSLLEITGKATSDTYANKGWELFPGLATEETEPSLACYPQITGRS